MQSASACPMTSWFDRMRRVRFPERRDLSGRRCTKELGRYIHMKKNRWLLRAVVLVLLSGILTTSVSLAAEAGSSDDPLVTLSYLNGTFLDSILERVDEKIAQRNNQSSGQASGTAADTFTVVTLSNGQTLTGSIGCEVMLRVGTAVCVSPSNPGLIDESAAVTLNNSGALVTNHLYMMTIEGRGVKATSGTVKLLVRGGYTIA